MSRQLLRARGGTVHNVWSSFDVYVSRYSHYLMR
jgi:hypothetical protein